jgi:thioredoxin-like negative regulator of GroEL
LARRARNELYQGRLEQAQRLVQQAVARGPASPFVLVAAGEIATAANDREGALEYYGRISADDRSLDALVGHGAAADLLVQLGRNSAAEVNYRRILAINPNHVLGHRRLAALLVMAGRRRESMPHLLALVRLGEYDLDELALLGNVDQIFDNASLIEQQRKIAPQEPLHVLAAGRIALLKNDVPRAAGLLKQVVATAPDQLEAHISLGRTVLELGRDDEIRAWHGQLPSPLADDPDVWILRGGWCERRGDTAPAIRCYWEAVRRDADQWKSNYQLAQLLEVRADARGAPFLERSKLLKSLNDILKDMLVSGFTGERLLECGRLTERLGRPWEAWAWFAAAAKPPCSMVRAAADRDRLESSLSDATPRTLDSANPARAVDLSMFPLPDWGAAGRNLERGPPASGRDMARVVFHDLARSAGLQFTFESGHDPHVAGLRTWQSFGGGVAVLDFDGDAWPDIYFAQGSDAIPPETGPLQPLDRLFRNLGSGDFADVTGPSGMGDERYSQGVAAGDYDDDGFTDLYVGNIGPNRLYHNNGDGTFSDVTESSGLGASGSGGSRWTASCLLADLNGDALPDIYEVTYLAGRGPFEKLCWDSDLQEHHICPPTSFDAEPDRLLVNRGDGTFADVSSQAGILAPDGKGLGIVAADFENSGRLNLYVSNDTTANFYFVNGAQTRGGIPAFQESAIAAGCAYDINGRAQASMGIAVEDADGDGLLDICITNFLNEYTVLYQQLPGGMFIDVSSAMGLKIPSVHSLGFGTQFLDGDLDGWPDLVVANGHVDDYRAKGLPFRMLPQFFSNQSGKRFVELSGLRAGEYFERAELGRGLARLDWNRDGREDFVVSHLDSPAALVTNLTEHTGHFVALSFRGIESGRDAIGTTVRLPAAGRVRVRQLTAGDGYYASNQRQLIFGLGSAKTPVDCLVRWPSGREQQFSGLAVDREWLLIEGRAAAVPLPHPQAFGNPPDSQSQ